MSQQNMLFSRLCASQHDLLLSISCKFHHWYLAPWFILAPRIKGKCLNGILSTAHARKTLETPFIMRNRSENDPTMIRDRSDHDPTTHETVSQPSHRRGRSSRFGDGLCMEKHRVSCICYLSKTHFVRDFLQNSIGNSSTSTTCNPIYSEGTISLLTLSVTNSFPH